MLCRLLVVVRQRHDRPVHPPAPKERQAHRHVTNLPHRDGDVRPAGDRGGSGSAAFSIVANKVIDLPSGAWVGATRASSWYLVMLASMPS